MRVSGNWTFSFWAFPDLTFHFRFGKTVFSFCGFYYLHTIARNSAINFLKHKYVHDTYLNSSQEIEYSSTSEEDLIAKELGLLIDDIVGKMSEQRKMIYTLSRQEGLSNAEIAIQLNTTKRNVESQLSLALKEIRKAISCFLLSFL